ncbi:very low-density lipoprotein receptor-like isoform X1 [Planococcus citri]|uniref:very low-density lipoprotein receptor-like isoform X1 n=1 Tax=Planococcus citri TaxID=170843 RepID=UPI0031F98947
MARLNIHTLLFASFFLIQTVDFSMCFSYPKTFRCRSGEYIRSNLFCDRDIDCIDGSDEASGCHRYGDCGPRRFTCADIIRCVSPSVLCDKNSDCFDGSDELNCGDQLDVGNCSLSDGKFLCHDGKRCLDLKYTCDGADNCFDGSDENENCTNYKSVPKECPHSFIHTPAGPICPCTTGNNNKSNSLCESLRNCTGSYSCEHHCHSFERSNSYYTYNYCSCYEGYHVDPNNARRCRDNNYFQNIIFYTTVINIKSLNLTTNRTSILTSGVNCTALAAAQDHVYYATSQSGKNYILKIPTDSHQAKGEKLIETDSIVTSIAVDYITGNIYYIANGSLFVCTNDGTICSTLKCCDVGYVALAPAFGLMFYTVKEQYDGSYYIMKSNMDGEDESILVDDIFSDSKILMAVDEVKKMVFYLMKKDNFHSDESTLALKPVTFDGYGGNIHMPIRSTTLSPIVSITLMDKTVFYTRINYNKLYYNRIENFTYSNSDSEASYYFQEKDSRILKYLYAHNKLSQSFRENPCATTSCPELCLLRPISSSNFTLTYSCRMENHIIYGNDTPTTSKHSTTKSYSNSESYSSPERLEKVTERFTAAELHKTSKSRQGHNFFAIVLMLLIIVAVLGFGSYYLWSHNRSLRQYYGSVSTWKWSKHNERVEIVEETEY